MAKIRRRAYPKQGALADPKYGKSGHARGKKHTGSRGQSDRGGKPN